MIIQQFYDKGLAQASYAIISEGQLALIDPVRDVQPYYDFAKQNNAKLLAIIETHLHADFISSHLELAQATGAKIYVSAIAEAQYPHEPFDDDTSIHLGKVTLTAINTPGHSPDSISILLRDEHKRPYAIFTGDTLFAGDVGRPDLRESEVDTKEGLARVLYYSLHKRILGLADDVLVYPAHGPGSLCGKNLGPELFTTIGKEKNANRLLLLQDENDFVEQLLQDQPYVPKYFRYNVQLNRKGALCPVSTIKNIPHLPKGHVFSSADLVVDIRPKEVFKAAHTGGAINIPLIKNFETWLGSIIAADEKFYFMGSSEAQLQEAAYRAASIGYEVNIKGMAEASVKGVKTIPLNLADFKNNRYNYTIVDIRNPSETTIKIFPEAILIPLPELRERLEEIPSAKPIVVHCAGGTRSAIGVSILEKYLTTKVFDLGEDITSFVF